MNMGKKKNMDLTRDQKDAIKAMLYAVMDSIIHMSDADKEKIVKQMKDHGDLENYALMGYFSSVVMNEVVESDSDDDEEYKIIG